MQLSYYTNMVPFKIKTAFDSQPFWQQLVITLLFNSFIAIVLNFIIPNSVFHNQMLMAQSIGLSIFISYLVSANLFELKKWQRLLPLIIGSIIGVSIAISIQATLLDAKYNLELNSLKENYPILLAILFSALFFGTIILALFSYREHIFITKHKLQAEQLNNIAQQKTIAETSLRMLQAQIEPHFLFNTLSNVISLIDTDPAKSKYLLETLTEFLRASLKRSTDSENHLQHEINLISKYLEIMNIRFGKRLQYSIHQQDESLDCVFPPLLLQPLVENAIIHGIEPLAEGGRIDIRITRDDNKLKISVSDTGKGFSSNHTSGFGLGNIRDRISSIYKNDGHLLIEENTPSGVIATIEVPYEPL